MGLRSDLDGLRVRMPGTDTVYLIDQGKKRGIPNPQVYNALFRTWDNIHLDIDIDAITTGKVIDVNAILYKILSDPSVFLYEYGTRRLIKSPAVMDRYQFDSNRIYVFPSIVFPDGPEITKTGRPD